MNEYLNLVEAARYLGISRMTLHKLIREGKVPTYWSELNRAVRLVKRADLDRLRQPRPAEDKLRGEQ
ncbi:MAG: helix-turn-helix domain-containing protein [Chloroflexi bacterium]|nr:helix-turn-helix domain-containing protein [Chloroflexota bacterium]